MTQDTDREDRLSGAVERATEERQRFDALVEQHMEGIVFNEEAGAAYIPMGQPSGSSRENAEEILATLVAFDKKFPRYERDRPFTVNKEAATRFSGLPVNHGIWVYFRVREATEE